jgi:hypothetical protein
MLFGIFIIEIHLGFLAFMLHDMDFNTFLSCDFEKFDGEEEAKLNDTCVTNDYVQHVNNIDKSQ